MKPSKFVRKLSKTSLIYNHSFQKTFVELMKSATSSVEFSFNNTMYKQTDGVAMGSPLGPALANIFVGYYEGKLFSQTQKSPTYFRYVDDTFAIFDHEAEADEFLTKLNCFHPSLRFTFEKEREGCLSILDVYVEKTDVSFETNVYRKPTFTGQYLRWESFSPLKRKTSLISILAHRALMICTKRRLNGEIERIEKILLDNGYPKNVIKAQIAKKIAQFSTLKRFGPEKCPVYLRVPWIGKPSTNLEKEVKAAMVPSAPAWFLHRSACCLWPARMFYLPFRKVKSYMNTSATVMVGT